MHLNLTSSLYAVAPNVPPPVPQTHTKQTQFNNFSFKMDLEDNDDDFYAPEPSTAPTGSEAPQDAPVTAPNAAAAAAAEPKEDADEDLEEGEEEDEGAMDEDDSSDSDGVGSLPVGAMFLRPLTQVTRVWSSSQRGRMAHQLRHHRESSSNSHQHWNLDYKAR